MSNVFEVAPEVLPTLKELFIQTGISNVPDFDLNPNSDVAILVAGCSTLVVGAEPTDNEAERISKICDSTLTFLLDETNISKTECLEITAKGISATLENSFRTITQEIHDIVDGISKNVEVRYANILRREKAENLLDDNVHEPSADDFVFLKWNGLTSPGIQNDIIETACDNISLVSKELSMMNLGYIVARCKFTEGYANISLPEETKTAITEKLKSVFMADPFNISEGEVLMMVDSITNQNGYANICSKAVMLMEDVTGIAKNCVFLNSLVNNFDLMFGSVLKNISDIVDSNVIDSIKSNISVVNKTIYAIKYFLLVNKEIRFKDTLVLRDEIINNDAFEEYTRQGGTIAKIFEFVKATFKDITIPVGGIGVGAVLDSNVDEMLARVNNKVRSEEKYIKSMALVEAFQMECDIYLKGILNSSELSYDEKSNLIIKFNGFVESKATMLGGHLGKVSDSLYEIIINVFYNDTLVKVLFKYLNSSFTDLCNSEADVENPDIVNSEAMASIDMIVEYLFDRLSA